MNRSPSWGYGVALAASVAIVVVKYALDRAFGYDSPLLLLFVPVLAAAWLAGMGPGLAASAVTTAGAAFLLLHPLHAHAGLMPPALHALLFLAEALLISALSASRFRAGEVFSRLAQIVQSTGDAVIGKDLNGVITTWNPAAEQLYGYSAWEAVGKPVSILAPPDRAHEFAGIMDRIRAGQTIAPYDTIRSRKDGSLVEVSLTISPIRDPSGGIVGASSIARDITERRRLEAFRSYVAEAAHCLLWYADVYETGRQYLEWRMQYPDATVGQRFLPLAMEEGKSYEHVFYWSRVAEDRDHCDRIGQASVRAGKSYAQDFRCRAADGSIRWLHEDVHVDTAVPGKQWRVVGVCTDVTERKLAEEAMRASEERYRHLSEAVPQMVWTTTPDGACDYVNERWREYTGMTLEQSLGAGWAAVIHPDDADRANEVWTSAVRAGSPYEMEARYRRADGTYRWHLVRAVPMCGPDGGVTHWFGTSTDIHDLKAAETTLARQNEEIEVLNERLQRAMTETHHRVKNNLQIIAAMVDMRLMDSAATLPAAEFKRLGSYVGTLAAVHDLLTHRSKEDGEAEYVSAQAMLEKLLPLMQHTAGSRRIRAEMQDAPLSTRQGTSLALVVNELVSNAIKYGRDGIRVGLTLHEETVLVMVADDGPGFPPDFDPSLAANTGLELVESLSRWDLAGETRYETGPDGGGLVTISFPLRGVPPARPAVHAVTEPGGVRREA